jgi:hypothetical protein
MCHDSIDEVPSSCFVNTILIFLSIFYVPMLQYSYMSMKSLCTFALFMVIFITAF